MLTITKPSPNRVDINLSGKLDAEMMREGLDDLIAKSHDVQSGRMLYTLPEFAIPTLGAFVVEVQRLPKLFGLLGKFDRCAVLSDAGRIRTAHRSIPIGVQQIVLDPIDAFALARISGKAAVRPTLRIGRQWPTAIAWVQVDVPTESPVIAGVFHEDGLVPALIQMSRATVSFGVPIGVSREPMLHAMGQIGLRSLDQGMNVIGHPTKGQDDPAAALDFVSESLCKPLVVTGIMEQLASSIATGDDVIIGARKLNPRWSWHRIGPKSRVGIDEPST